MFAVMDIAYKILSARMVLQASRAEHEYLVRLGFYLPFFYLPVIQFDKSCFHRLPVIGKFFCGGILQYRADQKNDSQRNNNEYPHNRPERKPRDKQYHPDQKIYQRGYPVYGCEPVHDRKVRQV